MEKILFLYNKKDHEDSISNQSQKQKSKDWIDNIIDYQNDKINKKKKNIKIVQSKKRTYNSKIKWEKKKSDKIKKKLKLDLIEQERNIKRNLEWDNYNLQLENKKISNKKISNKKISNKKISKEKNSEENVINDGNIDKSYEENLINKYLDCKSIEFFYKKPKIKKKKEKNINKNIISVKNNDIEKNKQVGFNENNSEIKSTQQYK